MNKTTIEETKALALKYDALASKLGSVTLSFMQLAALINEACERGEPIGFISAETLSDLKNPDWQSRRNTPANLWTVNNPPSRAVIPVYLGATVWSTDGKTSWVDAPQWGNAGATPPQPVAAEVAKPMALLAEEHKGMRVDYSGLLGQCQRELKRAGNLANAEMLRQLQGHLKELGQRWYSGDTAVVDEILQLYCIERDARAAMAGTGCGSDHK